MDMSSSKFAEAEDRGAQRASFEETYPRYEFAELVRLALAAAAWLVKLRRAGRQRPDVSIEPLPRDMNPAE